MKIICLLALVGGLFMLGLVFDIGYAQIVHERALEYWPRQESGALNLRMPGAIIGTVLVVIGLYGLLPKLPSARNTTITFKGANGDIVLQLKPIRKLLLKMMRRMPEVYSIKLDVRPDSDGRRACIDADVILKNCAALGARQSAKIVAECLATTARGLLGLEDLSTVRLNVKGIHVDVAATSKQIREQMARRQAEEDSCYAVARPPISAVTLGHDEGEGNAQEEDAPETVTEKNTADVDGSNVTHERYEQKASMQGNGAEEAEEEEEEQQESQLELETQPPETGKRPPVSEAPDEASVPQPTEMPLTEAISSAGYADAQPDALDDVELPQLVDRDVSLPPAPQIDDHGEIAADEPADIGDEHICGESAAKTAQAEGAENMEPASWATAPASDPPLAGEAEDADEDGEK